MSNTYDQCKLIGDQRSIDLKFQQARLSEA
jgi:hypothetical protein